MIIYLNMFEKHLLSGFILICVVPHSHQYQYYRHIVMNINHAATTVPERVIKLMAEYVQESTQRNSELKEMWFMYEESPQYEIGYLFHEVVDRYRKMVAHVRRPMAHAEDNVFMSLKHLEIIQHLFFEIYHLVHMMHEIPRKYAFLPEFMNLNADIDIEKVMEEQAVQEQKNKLEKRDKKKAKKFYKKLHTLAELEKQRQKKEKKNYNTMWPLDYGWEIDYWW